MVCRKQLWSSMPQSRRRDRPEVAIGNKKDGASTAAGIDRTPNPAERRESNQHRPQNRTNEAGKDVKLGVKTS